MTDDKTPDQNTNATAAETDDVAAHDEVAEVTTDTPAAAEAEPASSDPAPAPAEPARKGGGLALVLSLLALLASAGAGFMAWTWHQQQAGGASQLSQNVQALRGARDVLTERQDELQRAGQSLRQQGERQQAEIQALRAQLAETTQRLADSEQAVSQLAARIASGSDRWQLAEIEHLLLIANDNLLLGGDPLAAATALEIADQRIGALADPRLFGVRKQIAEELTALRAVPRPDIASLVLKLSSLASNTRRLALKDGGTPSFTPRRTEREAVVSDDPLKRFVGAMKEMFYAMFTIHRDADVHEPLMPPEQKYFLYQNLELQFEAARLAVLRRDETQLRATLQSAEAWLHRYFDGSRPAVQSALQTIAELQGTRLQPPMPDISGSLEALRSALEAG